MYATRNAYQPYVKKSRYAYASRRGARRVTLPFSNATRARYNIRQGGYMGLELKYYDTSLAANSIASSTGSTGGEADPSATILFNTVIQGDGPQNRDGRKITMKSLMIRGLVKTVPQSNQTTTDGASNIMIALVLDKQTNKATIASENVFTNKGASTQSVVLGFNNLENSGRYRVLKRLQLKIPVQQPVYDGTNIEMQGEEIYWEIAHSFGKGLIVNYTANTTEDVANITDNSLHLIAFASSSAAAPTIAYNARLRFMG